MGFVKSSITIPAGVVFVTMAQRSSGEILIPSGCAPTATGADATGTMGFVKSSGTTAPKLRTAIIANLRICAIATPEGPAPTTTAGWATGANGFAKFSGVTVFAETSLTSAKVSSDEMFT
jgi:hypothetical protein